MDNHKVGIVLLNFNSGDLTASCIRSLLGLTYLRKEIICVDNDSTDGSSEKLGGMFPNVYLIRNERNLGYGAAVNIGFRKGMDLGCDLLFCFNNDAVAGTLDLIEILVHVFEEDSSMGIACPEEWDITGTRLLYSGPSGRNKFEMRATGAAFMISKDVLLRHGDFDEAFFLGGEDYDLFFRVERAGYRVVTVPGARIRHARSATIGKHGRMMAYLTARNVTIMLFRHWGIGGVLVEGVKSHVIHLIELSTSKGAGNRRNLVRPYLKGLVAGVLLLPSASDVGGIPPFDPTPWMDSRVSKLTR